MAEMSLPETLDLRAAAPLKAALLNLRGQPVAIDASAVGRIGGLCLQVLLAARRTWSADGQPFRVAGASPAFVDAMRRFGASELTGAAA